MNTQFAGNQATLAADHAGVDPRNGFLPPRARVTRLIRDTTAAWAAVPPVPALTDPSGEAILIGRAAIRLAYDQDRLYVRARIRERQPVIRPEWGPGSNHFWEQDHVEIRFLRDPRHDLDQLQFIITLDGRVWDNQGLWKKGELLRCDGHRNSDGWLVQLAVPFAAAGLPLPVSGDIWRGIVAHTRWGSGRLDMACSSATELGFSQAERFGEWVFSGPPESVLMESVTKTCLCVVNRSRQPVRAAIVFSPHHVRTLRLTPGANRITLSLMPKFPGFTRYSFGIKGAPEWGSVALCGPLPPLRLTGRSALRPSLLFDAGELQAIRAKMEFEPFRSERARFNLAPADLSGAGVPSPDDPVSFAITRDCMNWFRVAKETMLRDGEGKRNSAAAYLWGRQSEQARKAWRAIVKSVKPAEVDQDVLIRELNRLLARRDFYNPRAFADVHLPEEGRELLGRGMSALREDEVIRLNRMILQSAVECIGAYRMDLVSKPGDLWGKWLVTGDNRLIATATRAVRAALRLTIMDHQVHLHEGVAAGSVALAYDSFHPHLSVAERKDWQSLLLRFLRLYLETARSRGWTLTTIANANPVGNGGCGLAALALLRECPGVAKQTLDYVRRYIRLWLDYCQGADGGNTEGVQYWQYGMENFLRFARALERVTGSDDGLLGHPAVTQALNMIRVSLCNDGALHGVNDTIPMPVGGPIAWFLAARTGDPLGLWYGDHALKWLRARQKAGKPIAYDISLLDLLLNRPAVAAPGRQPPLPVSFMMEDIQVGILRSGKAFNCRWTAGLKGSRPPYTHHNQRDTGSLFVDLRGERLLMDPGYYKPEPGDHALPLIGGKGPVQPQAWTGVLTSCGARGSFRWLSVDATAAYGGSARRVERHLVMVGNEGLVLLDDIEADAHVTAQYTCGGIIGRGSRGRSVTVKGDKARLRMDLLTRIDARLVVHPERSLHDVHWGYHFADGRLFPVTVDYIAEGSDPLVTVFLDVTVGAPGTCRLEKAKNRLIVRLPSGTPVSFERQENSWSLIRP